MVVDVKKQINEQISSYYTRCLEFINDKKWELATKELYSKMPNELYDLSIDILFNSNLEFSDETLRKLITKVDGMLTEYSTNKEIEPDIIDEFIGDIF